MASFLVRLSDDELEELRAVAEREGRSMNEVARQAIAERVQRAGWESFRTQALAQERERWADLYLKLADT